MSGIDDLEDLEDVYLADQVLERIRKGKETSSTLDEAEARLGLDR